MICWSGEPRPPGPHDPAAALAHEYPQRLRPLRSLEALLPPLTLALLACRAFIQAVQGYQQHHDMPVTGMLLAASSTRCTKAAEGTDCGFGITCIYMHWQMPSALKDM